eukprot:183275-Prorocentrum_minimum.AAC.1
MFRMLSTSGDQRLHCWTLRCVKCRLGQLDVDASPTDRHTQSSAFHPPLHTMTVASQIPCLHPMRPAEPLSPRHTPPNRSAMMVGAWLTPFCRIRSPFLTSTKRPTSRVRSFPPGARPRHSADTRCLAGADQPLGAGELPPSVQQRVLGEPGAQAQGQPAAAQGGASPEPLPPAPRARRHRRAAALLKPEPDDGNPQRGRTVGGHPVSDGGAGDRRGQGRRRAQRNG